MSLPGPPRRGAPLWVVAIGIAVAAAVMFGLISLGARPVHEPPLTPLPSMSSSA
jgi:hypothetical protein